MVSAVRPGPKVMAQPVSPDFARFKISSNTNMMVAEDMLPLLRRTSREQASASGVSERLFSTESRMERPPGWTAHQSMEEIAWPRVS